MNMHRPFHGVSDPNPLSVTRPYLCWTRMQSEAGQGLEEIIARKEAERQAGTGLFFWGVGNAPATAIRTLARCEIAVPVIFSIMKSRPKPADVAPEATVAWTRFIDAHGVERPLPDHVLVTSRRDSAGGPKQTHFALMCFSEEPLELRRGTSFDHCAYRNAGGLGAPVGASQVTALLQQLREPATGSYEVNLQAMLTGSYWVKLTGPVALPSPSKSGGADIQDTRAQWLTIVKEARAASFSQEEPWDLLRQASA